MHLYKKVLIVTLMVAFVASMGAAAVSAQTSATASTPAVGAAYKTPTTSIITVSSQSVKPYVKITISQWLRTGSAPIKGMPIHIWELPSTNPTWYPLVYQTKTTNANGFVSWSFFIFKPLTIQYKAVFLSAGSYAAATSNIVTVKIENTKTKPYQTTLYAYATKQVVPHGATATMSVKLLNGQTPLTGKSVYVWKWSGGKWVNIGKTTTLTAPAGWARVPEKLTKAGSVLYHFTFAASSPYGPSTSNVVQLVWT